MKLSRCLLFSCQTSKSTFGFGSITEYYETRRLLSEKLLNLIDETNANMNELYSNPKQITLYNCFNELSRVTNEVPEPRSLNTNVDNQQIDFLASKIVKDKNELLETFRELENLEIKKKRFFDTSKN